MSYGIDMSPNFGPLARLFKALAEANRLRIIHVLADGEMTVSQIVEATELSQPLVSHHLRALREASIVRSQRDGPFVRHTLVDAAVLERLDAWRDVVGAVRRAGARTAQRTGFAELDAGTRQRSGRSATPAWSPFRARIGKETDRMRHAWAQASCCSPEFARGFEHGPPWRAMGELWGLFGDWLESLEDEVVAFARERGTVKADDVDERFKISRRAARTLLRRLQRTGRVESQGYTARSGD